MLVGISKSDNVDNDTSDDDYDQNFDIDLILISFNQGCACCHL